MEGNDNRFFGLLIRWEPLELTHTKPLAWRSWIISLGVIGMVRPPISHTSIYVFYVFVNGKLTAPVLKQAPGRFLSQSG